MRIVSYFKQVFCQKKSFYGILEGNNQYKIKVVGINHYEQLIRKKLQRRESFYKVVLVSDENNFYDKNAVKVVFDGDMIGHLEKKMALMFRKYMQSLGYKYFEATCSAQILQVSDGSVLDVWLDLPSNVFSYFLDSKNISNQFIFQHECKNLKNIKLNINDTLDFWSPDGESIIYLFAPNTSFGDGNLGHLVRDIELIIWAKINLNYDVELKIVDIDLKVNKVTIMVSCTQYNLVTLDDDELYESEWKKISKKYNPKKTYMLETQIEDLAVVQLEINDILVLNDFDIKDMIEKKIHNSCYFQFLKEGNIVAETVDYIYAEDWEKIMRRYVNQQVLKFKIIDKYKSLHYGKDTSFVKLEILFD